MRSPSNSFHSRGALARWSRLAQKAPQAAAALKMTASDLLDLKLVDEVVPEPAGGAHEDWDAAAANLSAALKRVLADFANSTPQQLINDRYQKFRRMGNFFTEAPV